MHEISKTLGLSKANKYVNIQVQRGWSSDRDIMGFYNKLTHVYEADRFGLYKLINSLQDTKLEDQFSIVLLDEANLSPLEHYWSGFMGACDEPNTFSTQGTPLKLPAGIRFLATVNYDRTTEQLSERYYSPCLWSSNCNRSKMPSEHSSKVKSISSISNRKAPRCT